MNKSYKSWATWSVTVFIVWGIIFLIRWGLKSSPSIGDLALIFAGYCAAWIIATVQFVLITKKIN